MHSLLFSSLLACRPLPCRGAPFPCSWSPCWRSSPWWPSGPASRCASEQLRPCSNFGIHAVSLTARFRTSICIRAPKQAPSGRLARMICPAFSSFFRPAGGHPALRRHPLEPHTHAPERAGPGPGAHTRMRPPPARMCACARLPRAYAHAPASRTSRERGYACALAGQHGILSIRSAFPRSCTAPQSVWAAAPRAT